MSVNILPPDQRPFIRTILGDVAPEKFGPCYAHEHLFIAPCKATRDEPDFLINDLESAFLELRAVRATGVRALIDCSPCGYGRDISKLANLAAETAMNIVASTGLHLEKYYYPDHWSHHFDSDKLAELFIADIEEGIDLYDYTEPNIRRTAHRAGIIKIAALECWGTRTKGIFAAAAQAHLKTGAPIITHTENGTLALEQAQLLIDSGVAPDHIVLSHLDKNPDTNNHQQVLQTGVTIEYDSHFRQRHQTTNPTLELLKVLLPEFPEQIVLGMDAARQSYWSSYGGSPGLSWLYTEFRREMLEAGIAEAHIHKIFVSTPAKVFRFRA